MSRAQSAALLQQGRAGPLPGRTRFPRGLAARRSPWDQACPGRSQQWGEQPTPRGIVGTGVQACVIFRGGSSKDAATWCAAGGGRQAGGRQAGGQQAVVPTLPVGFRAFLLVTVRWSSWVF